MGRKTYGRKLIEDRIPLVKFVCVDHLGASFLSPVMSCSPSIAERTGKTFTKGSLCPTFRQAVGGKTAFCICCFLIAFGSK